MFTLILLSMMFFSKKQFDFPILFLVFAMAVDLKAIQIIFTGSAG